MEKEIVEKEVEEFGDPSWAVDSALDLVDSVPHGMEEPVHFGGPGSFVRIVEDVLKIFQCFLIVFLNGQSLSQITDIIYAL